MDDIDENFVKDLVNQYLKENDLPSETILWYLLLWVLV
jgi:hypothetical protein